MSTKFNTNEFSINVQNMQIDLFITSSSFEERCFIVPRLIQSKTIKKSIIFYNENEVKEIKSNADILCSELLKNGKCIALDSDKPVLNYSRIDLAIRDCYTGNSKANVLIDSTTFTHESLLILMKLLSLKKEFFGKILFTYVGAKNYSIHESKDEDKWLSKGIHEIRTVLGYPGFTDPTQKNHLMILFGFESERTKRIIEEYEFENITLGFSDVDNSIQSNHYKINVERHEKLMKEYSHAKKFTFSLTDPLDAKNQIIQYLSTPFYSSLNTVLAPLNNKISTIGAGIAALENENIQIAYAKPNLYNTRGYSEPNDIIYLFEVPF